VLATRVAALPVALRHGPQGVHLVLQLWPGAAGSKGSWLSSLLLLLLLTPAPLQASTMT
jgi:hypothetical protein